jgi:hypothetical protein
MKPVNRDKQLGLASPLECAASQSGKIKAPLIRTHGWMQATVYVSREGREENFSLDILFHRMSVTALRRKVGRSQVNSLFIF